MKKISVEEHCLPERLQAYMQSRADSKKEDVVEESEGLERQGLLSPQERWQRMSRMGKLADLGEERLKDMDEAGIDMQVLSTTIPGVEDLEAAEGITVSRIINDELSEVVKKYPERFAAFAAIAPQALDDAASELERAVKDLGLSGIMINSHVRGEYLDAQKYWVIFEMAEKLGAPIYIHPKEPSPDMIKPYLTYSVLTRAMWGFAAEAGLHAMRLIVSGVFDAYPGLQIILGHMGESLPYWLWRLDKQWEHEKLGKGVKQLQREPSEYIRENFYVTTSGMFWPPALEFVNKVLGADRILFAVDYPYESITEAAQFIESAPISDSDKEKICHLNTEKLLRLPV